MSFRRSLRLRLLLVGLAGVAVAALLLALWLGQAYREASQRTFDRELQEELHTLLVALEADEQGRIFLQAEPEDQHYAQPPMSSVAVKPMRIAMRTSGTNAADERIASTLACR